MNEGATLVDVLCPHGGAMGVGGPSSPVSLVKEISATLDQAEGTRSMSASTRVRYDPKEWRGSASGRRPHGGALAGVTGAHRYGALGCHSKKWGHVKVEQLTMSSMKVVAASGRAPSVRVDGDGELEREDGHVLG